MRDFTLNRYNAAIPVKVTDLLSVGAALCRNLDKIAPKGRSYRKAALPTE